MNYLDYDRLEAIDPTTFQSQRPYPWVNPQGVLTEKGYQSLIDSQPDVSLLEETIGYQRGYGQKSHDRFDLRYDSSNNKIAQPWHDFVAELSGERYMSWLRGLFDRKYLNLYFHWHYAFTGCSVSPHCDIPQKLGSHIFYLNTEKDWDLNWGGQTLILDDHGKFQTDGAGPDFDEFESMDAGKIFDNHSLLFGRKGNSWHGVRELKCPEDAFRKVFIVMIEQPETIRKIRKLGRMFGLPS